ncbi:MAG: Carboxy-terminal-processing protease [Parcubacteria group bacterium Athens0416_74]|nr:MAG: Carboxy-terminal-processing protease [Parcubacteria group bacterium Athens0416_74]
MNEKRSISYATAAPIAALILVLGFIGGSSLGGSPVASLSTDANMPEGVDFSPVWRAWSIIDEKFVPASVATSTVIASTTADRNQERVWGMVEGLASSLNDPYTFFLPPAENEQFGEDMSGKFEGVGMEIAVRDQVLTIVTPLKGTPAERAGLKSGDKILKIDGKDTHDLDVSGAIKLIRGPKGTVVTLTIAREGDAKVREVEVTRDVINVPIVTTKNRDDGVFVIQVSQFTANSTDHFRNALREFVQSGKTKLVLDLRGNPGGYLDAAVDMASWFLPSGKVVVTEDYAGHADNIVHRSSGYNVFNENLKMVILVDRGSASASEILADALRHYGIAKMVGTNTFGKGSVQELVTITQDTALKITVARWLGPDGEQIPLTGIVPDVEVKVSEEDLKEKRDPQLDKAIEMLNI